MCNTDHRGLIMTFDARTLFGRMQQSPPNVHQRKLKSNDRISVTKFIETMHSHILANNGFFRGNSLRCGSDQASQLAESLDNLIGEAGDIAEKRCTPRRQPWYSKKLIRLRYIVSLLRHYVNGLRVNIDRRPTIQTRLNKVGHNSPLPFTLGEAQLLLRTYHDELSAVAADSAERRHSELTNEALAHSLNGNKAKAKVIRKINRSEQNRKTWRMIKFMSHKSTTPTMDRLEIPESWPEMVNDASIHANITLEDPKTAVRWKTVEDPRKIEMYLMLRNYLHFGQAFGTPFTVDPLRTQIDWTATTPEATQILIGVFDDSSILDPL